MKHGATREEVGEAIAIAIGINAAAIVDQTDIANWSGDLVAKLWEKNGSQEQQAEASEQTNEKVTP